MLNGIASENIQDVSFHVNVLKKEIEYLRKKIQLHDTGHIITAIYVLEDRVKEIEKSQMASKKLQETSTQ